jgi:hypothetical protein
MIKSFMSGLLSSGIDRAMKPVLNASLSSIKRLLNCFLITALEDISGITK